MVLKKELSVKKIFNPCEPVFIKFNNYLDFLILIVGLLVGIGGFSNFILVEIFGIEKPLHCHYKITSLCIVYIVFLFLEIKEIEDLKNSESTNDKPNEVFIPRKNFIYLLKPILIIYSLIKQFIIWEIIETVKGKKIFGFIHIFKSKKLIKFKESLSKFLGVPINEIFIDIFEYPDYWQGKGAYEKNVIRFGKYTGKKISFDLRLLKDEQVFEVRQTEDESIKYKELEKKTNTENLIFEEREIPLRIFQDILKK
jgi:hypothetical protein